MRAARLAVPLAAILALLLASGAAAARFAVRVFARVPAPGYPANAIVSPDGTVYAGTFKSFSSPSDSGPSKVFAFSPAGALERTYTVQGQMPGTADAVQVATLDRAGTLYLLDQSPARVIKLDPRTGAQTTWATFRTVPACSAALHSNCTDGMAGNPPEPDFAVWGPDGALYVTDYNQSLVWRIPASGGPASVWLTDPRLNGVIVGPAGIALEPDGRTLMLDTGGGGTDPATGKLYTVPIEPDGLPGPLHQVWESAPLEAPDGFAISRSGDVYIALVGPSGNAVVEVSPQGRQLARVPADAAANQAEPIPFDAPGSVTFDGDTVLVGNQSSIANDPAHWAILAIDVGEPGLPVSLPPAPPPRIRYRLTVTPHRVAAGRRVRLRFRASELVDGVSEPLRGATVRIAGRHARTGRRGRASVRVVLRRPGRRYRARLILARRRVATVTVTTRRRRGFSSR